MERPSNTTLALLGGIGILIFLLVVFAATRDSDQDKIGDAVTFSVDNPDLNKACAGQAIYDQIKRALFAEAQKARANDLDSYKKLAATASIRVENPAAEGEGRSPGLVDCSGSMAIDLPPGISTVAGRRLLMSDIYYAVDPQAKRVLQLRNADGIVAELAGLKVEALEAQPTIPAADDSTVIDPVDPLAPIDPGVSPPTPPTLPGSRPSFDCGRARTPSERMICSDPGLAALDRNMAAEYARAMGSVSPTQQAQLRQSRDRFLAYRDTCPNPACVAGAYNDRVREIRDIAAGRWQPNR